MTDKVCSKCNLTKPLDAFGRDNRHASKSKILAACRDCRAAHGRAYSPKHYYDNRQYHVKKNKMSRDDVRCFVNGYRHQKMCTDCKFVFPYWVLQFDHIHGKKIYNVCSMPGQYGLGKVKEEIAKCELVCVNCHETRTWNRRQLKKSPRNFHYTNSKKLIAHKESNPCKDCGVQYRYFVMQLDHLPEFEKSFNVCLSSVVGKDWNTIQNEINKCQVVCANCHADRTYLRKRGGA